MEEVSDRAKMKELMSGFEQIEIIPLGNISARSRYTAMVKAFLEPIKVEAIEQEDFDLMVLRKYLVTHSK